MYMSLLISYQLNINFCVHADTFNQLLSFFSPNNTVTVQKPQFENPVYCELQSFRNDDRGNIYENVK